jgi:hypothetical protein
MRDYGNMPLLDWTEENATEKAVAQILRQEPVILQMPTGFEMSCETEKAGCETDSETGILFNCDGFLTLSRLADLNRTNSLRQVAEACRESSSLADIDVAKRRVIVHD